LVKLVFRKDSKSLSSFFKEHTKAYPHRYYTGQIQYLCPLLSVLDDEDENEREPNTLPTTFYGTDELDVLHAYPVIELGTK